MTSSGNSNRAAAAIRFLQSRHLYLKYDALERVTHVAIYDATGADEIAEHVGQLLDLQNLTFTSTDLTVEGLRYLRNLVNLEVLWLTSPKLSGDALSSLIGMSSMTELILEAPVDGRGLRHIAQLHNLRELSIQGGTFHDEEVAPLAGLGNLERLSFPENECIHGVCATHLTGLARLRRFNPGIRITDDGLKCVAGLARLEEFDAVGDFTDTGLLELGCLAELQSLAVKSKLVTSRGIGVAAKLPALECLYLQTPLLTDDAIPSLLLCSALEEMVVWNAAISESGIEKLRSLLPKCSVADMLRDWPQHAGQVEELDDRPRIDDNAPFATLLAEARDLDLVNGTFKKIGDRYGHMVDALQYSPEERVVMLVWHSAGLIENGGFEYLFAGEFDGDPDFRLTAEAYKTAGLDRSYEAFQTAFSLFPTGNAPIDPAERSRLYDSANRSARDRINRNLWTDRKAHEKKLAEFIRKNVARFGEFDDS